MDRREFERIARLEAQQRQAELEAQKGNPHFQLGETIREKTWNFCKQYDMTNRQRVRVLLINFITTELENLFGTETENLFRSDWLEEVDLFCEKYQYAT